MKKLSTLLLMMIICAGSYGFAQETVDGNGMTALPTPKIQGVTVTSPSPTIPTTVSLPAADACTQKADEDRKNSVLGLEACKTKNSLSDCQKQYEEQKEMINTTLESCKAEAACTKCKTDFCAKETVSCDLEKTKAACASVCGTDDENTENTTNDTMGITLNPECLKNGQCGFKIYDFMGRKQDIPAETRTSPTLFIQDILLAATFFIGTVLTLALIFSGIQYIMAGVNGKEPSKAKDGIKYSIIGLLLVIGSYSIIRLVQYIAKGF